MVEVKLIIFSVASLFVLWLIFDNVRLKNKNKKQAGKIKGLKEVKKVGKKIGRRKKAIDEAKEKIDNAEKPDIDKHFDS